MVQTDSKLEIDILEKISNPNLKRVVLSALRERELMEKDPDYRIHGTYSEAYQGEKA